MMESAFGWLGRLMETIGSLFPRLVIIKSTHGGVAFVRGKHAREIKPGLMWYWPIWTTYILYPVVRQTLNLPSQTLTTGDHKAVTISTVIVYSVADILKALTIQWDLSDTIQDITLVAVREYTQAHTFDELLTDQTRELRDVIKQRVRPYGIRVLEAKITDLAQSKVLTLIQPNGGSSIMGGDD